MIDFEARLHEGARRMGLQLSEDGVARLACHQRLLVRWSGRMNLTAIRDPDEMVDRLYLDGAVLIPLLGSGVSVHDVGSGAGFPGLVLKALRPDLRVTLTEARNKRVSFLRQAAREMGLLGEGLDIRWQRLGWDVAGEEQWDEVVSRAVFPPAEWIVQGSALVAPRGRLWVMSGPPVETEEEEESSDDSDNWRKAPPPSGFEPAEVHPYRLPFSGLARVLVSMRRRRG